MVVCGWLKLKIKGIFLNTDNKNLGFQTVQFSNERSYLVTFKFKKKREMVLYSFHISLSCTFITWFCWDSGNDCFQKKYVDHIKHHATSINLVYILFLTFYTDFFFLFFIHNPHNSFLCVLFQDKKSQYVCHTDCTCKNTSKISSIDHVV